MILQLCAALDTLREQYGLLYRETVLPSEADLAAARAAIGRVRTECERRTEWSWQTMSPDLIPVSTVLALLGPPDVRAALTPPAGGS